MLLLVKLRKLFIALQSPPYLIFVINNGIRNNQPFVGHITMSGLYPGILRTMINVLVYDGKPVAAFV